MLVLGGGASGGNKGRNMEESAAACVTGVIGYFSVTEREAVLSDRGRNGGGVAVFIPRQHGEKTLEPPGQG